MLGKLGKVGYYNLETGDEITKEEYDSILEEEKKKSKKNKINKTATLVSFKSLEGFNFNSKINERRGFAMIFYNEDVLKDLEQTERWIFDKLSENLLDNGSCRSIISTEDIEVNTHSKLLKYCKLSKQKGLKTIKSLEDKNVIYCEKVGRNYRYYINPYFYRRGNFIEKKARDFFRIPEDYLN